MKRFAFLFVKIFSGLECVKYIYFLEWYISDILNIFFQSTCIYHFILYTYACIWGSTHLPYFDKESYNSFLYWLGMLFHQDSVHYELFSERLLLNVSQLLIDIKLHA